MNSQENKPILFGLSNTFINWFAVASQSLLDKYGLAFGADVELTQEQTKVFEDLEMLEGYQEIAGGSTLNTIRAFSFMMKKNYQRNHSALFFGSIGTDAKGETVKRLFDEEKIDYRFDEHDGYSTDQCAVIIVNSERTPVSFWRVNQLIRTQHVIDTVMLFEI